MANRIIITEDDEIMRIGYRMHLDKLIGIEIKKTMCHSTLKGGV